MKENSQEAVKYFNDVLHLSMKDFPKDFKKKDIPEEDFTLRYIANIMSDFIPSDNYTKCSELFGRWAFIFSIYLNISPLSMKIGEKRKLGDYALFGTGMFPESLEKRGLLSEVSKNGILAYKDLSYEFGIRSEIISLVYERLSKRFPLYRDLINNARDKYMKLRIDPDERFVINIHH